MDKAAIDALRDAAFSIRCSTIREIASFGSGHIGGSMSIIEILTYLYYREMDTDPSDPGIVLEAGKVYRIIGAVLDDENIIGDEGGNTQFGVNVVVEEAVWTVVDIQADWAE